jgi:glutathione S-transferase
MKVRRLLEFKGIEHSWIPRTAANQGEFLRFAKLPLIPVLVGSDDYTLQDSTPIVEKLEHRYPDPSVTPASPALKFLAHLFEDYADEWVNKIMFHYRWTGEADQISAAQRIAAAMLAGQEAPDLEAVSAAIRERMVQRLHHVGSSPQTAPVIESSFQRLLALLEMHLADRLYLFGARPSLGDFGLAAQLGQLLSDPTPGAHMRATAPRVVAYVERMNTPSVEGDFEPLDALTATLRPLLDQEVCPVYLAWMSANAEAAREGGTVSLELPGGPYEQGVQKYAAKAFGDLRKRRAQAVDDAGLAALMSETGCDAFLSPPAGPVHDDDFDDGENEQHREDRHEANAATDDQMDGGGAQDEPLASPDPAPDGAEN